MARPSQASSATAGRNAHLFQPPKSPASTVFSPAVATSSTDYFSSQCSRKRARPDSSQAIHQNILQTPQAASSSSWVQCPTPSDPMYISADGQSAHVNERYRLAGGYDTPGLLASEDFADTSARYGGDGELRRRVRDLPDRYAGGGTGIALAGPLARERNGAARMPSSPNGSDYKGGLMQFAFGVVGKVFNFGTNVIKGFYAGGGTGYDMQQSSASILDNTRIPDERATPVPGSWRDDEFLGDFEQDNPNTPTISVRPSNKRRQTDKDSWVLVGTPEMATDSSPKRKVTTSIPRPTRPSLAGHGASRANARRSFAPAVSRRQTAHMTTFNNSSPFAQTPESFDPQRRASIAPTRTTNSRPSSSSNNNQESPSYLSPEVERFVKRQARQDRAADKTMSTMSRQLEDLIRQGQQALGTKYEVESGSADTDMGIDEGYGNEEW